MKISIVIPMYNGGKDIPRCLDAIERQSIRPHEVIVVDNNSLDDSFQSLKQAVSNWPRLNIIIEKETKPGPAAARNKGISLAKGDIVAFTDADCIPRQDWIKNIQSIFETDPELDAVGGIDDGSVPDISLCGKFLSAFWLPADMLPKKVRFEQKEDLFNKKFVATFNCCYKKNMLLKIQGFNEVYAFTGEDFDLLLRASEKGAKIIVWDDRVVVFHRQNISFKTLLQKAFGYGLAMAKLTKFHFSNKVIIKSDLGEINGIAHGIPMIIFPQAFRILVAMAILGVLFAVSPRYANLLLCGIIFYLPFNIKRRINNKGYVLSLWDIVQCLFIFIGRKSAEEAGRIYGSFKYKVICL